jgi:hypothetical protein
MQLNPLCALRITDLPPGFFPNPCSDGLNTDFWAATGTSPQPRLVTNFIFP